MKLLRGVISFLKDTFYYLIAVPILFLVNKFVLGYKLIGKENIKKVPGAKITISNHVHTIDCSMNGLVSFPQYCYFVTLQSNIDLPFIGKLVRLLRGIPIPLKISEKEKFYEEVVFSDKAPDINEYKTYYESIDPENAEVLYKQVVEQITYDDEVQDYAKTYSQMKPKEAAAIFDTMTDNLGLVSDILMCMGAQARADILGKMNAETAAKLTEIMEPSKK